MDSKSGNGIGACLCVRRQSGYLSGISGVFDPELLGSDWGDGKLYPLQRTISIGLNVNF